MPTIDQAIETLEHKKRKFGGGAHVNRVIVSEEARQEAIANVPDASGRQKTRISLETYSPKAYSAWNAAIEYLMERSGCNPLIVVDLLLLFVQEAQKPSGVEGMDGIDIAQHGLFAVHNYEDELIACKRERRMRKKARYSGQTLGEM